MGQDYDDGIKKHHRGRNIVIALIVVAVVIVLVALIPVAIYGGLGYMTVESSEWEFSDTSVCF